MLTKNGGYEMCVRLVIHCYIFSLLAITYQRKNRLLNWTRTDQRTSQILLASFQKITQVTNNKLRSDRKNSGQKRKNSDQERKTQGKNRKNQVSAILKFFDIRKSGQKKACATTTASTYGIFDFNLLLQRA